MARLPSVPYRSNPRRARRIEGVTPDDEDDNLPIPAPPPPPAYNPPPLMSNAAADAAINAAMSQQRPIDLEGAFPDAPLGEQGQARISGAMSNHEYRREYRLKLLHRMIMRSLPLDLIAQSLSCSVATVQRLRLELSNRFRQEAQSMDLESYVGQTIAYYNEIGGMAMRIAGTNTTPAAVKIKAMHAAMQTRRDVITFLDKVGFHDSIKLTPKVISDDLSTSNAATLLDMAKDILSDTYNEPIDEHRNAASDAMDGDEGSVPLTEDERTRIIW